LRGVGVRGGEKLLTALPAGKSLPVLPLSGIKSAEDFKGMNVVSVIDMTGLAIFAPVPILPSTLTPDHRPEESFQNPAELTGKAEGTWFEGAILAVFG
jgi:hypothetical protein